MGYANLLVHVQLGQPNRALLKLVKGLATACQAGVTGIAARQPIRIVYAEGYVPEGLIEQDQADIEAEITAAEAEFHAAFQSGPKPIAWRSAITYEALSAVLAREARCADLVVTGLDQEGTVFEVSRHVDVGDLVMQAGRPCLIVPADLDALDLQHVVVGWKDTAEARRAARDALPLLALAKQVTVVELARADDMATAQGRVQDVTAWLARHGISAQPVVERMTDDVSQLDQFLTDRGADLIVAGAYGHSRVREWVLGGMTRNLLLRGKRCALVSH
ncbi:MAG TPA: universal stress protein [Rhodopila sp.]|nr:universal stress protein [Rhodopila sp.]